MDFILASNNPGKLEEMQKILTVRGFDAQSQSEAGINLSVEETGTTFLENARLKAEMIVRLTGRPAIADDSGLIVEALDGRPGVDSAIYGGVDCKSDKERCCLLLSEMAGIENRRAKFQSTIVALFPNGVEVVSVGEWEGEIALAPYGNGGFGYDPVFFIPGLGKTAAQLTSEEKNEISHRAKALGIFCTKLEQI